jgi:eukaryotic-like serine/threonine-protein kinase
VPAGGPTGDGRGRSRGSSRRRGTIIASLLGLAALIAAIVALIVTTDTGGDDSGATTFIEVPDVINQSFNDAKVTLEAEGFEVSRRERQSSQPPDVVLNQDPAAGDNLEKGRTVRLTVSSTTFTMPELAGKQRADAINELLRRGLANTAANVHVVEEDSDRPVGEVLRTTPPAGESVQKADGQIELVVAREPPILVPDLTGFDVATAQQTLSQAGFQVTTAREPNDTVPAERVTRTDPAGGATAPRGSSITIFISTGPQDLVVPEVRNLPEAQATQTLQAAGFQVARAEQPVSSPLQNGVVVATNPNPGERRPPQSFVTITVGRFTVTGPTTTTR